MSPVNPPLYWFFDLLSVLGQKVSVCSCHHCFSYGAIRVQRIPDVGAIIVELVFGLLMYRTASGTEGIGIHSISYRTCDHRYQFGIGLSRYLSIRPSRMAPRLFLRGDPATWENVEDLGCARAKQAHRVIWSACLSTGRSS